jgi:hypothetical protein
MYLIFLFFNLLPLSDAAVVAKHSSDIKPLEISLNTRYLESGIHSDFESFEG